MSDLFASIKRGLEAAVAHQKGEKTGVRLFTPEEVNVKQVREKTGLTQERFAATFGISLGTLRHWERGDGKSHGPALVPFNAVAKEPGTVLWEAEESYGPLFGVKNEPIWAQNALFGVVSCSNSIG